MGLLKPQRDRAKGLDRVLIHVSQVQKDFKAVQAKEDHPLQVFHCCTVLFCRQSWLKARLSDCRTWTQTPFRPDAYSCGQIASRVP